MGAADFERAGVTSDAESTVSEKYWSKHNRAFRRVTAGAFCGTTSMTLPARARRTVDPAKLKYWWDWNALRGASVRATKMSSVIRIADLFCGCGGFGLGISRATQALGVKPRFLLAADTDRNALHVYQNNLSPHVLLNENLWSLVDFQIMRDGNGRAAFLRDPRLIHPALRSLVGNVDMIIGGPPCEGHSRSNNATRNNDPRNLLYLVPLAVGVATGASFVIIENVPDVKRDRFAKVASVARELAESRGYRCDDAVIHALDIGVPQTRRRHILIASKHKAPSLQEVVRTLRVPQRDVRFAIGDLVRASGTPLDAAANLSPENRRRIDFLFDNGLFNLPDKVRPDCHKNGHTYPSVYGRLSWALPSGTITTGFMTPGRGRYVHPELRRALTPHEAARIQGIPDCFNFDLGVGETFNSFYGSLIGDAVPPQVGYAAGLAALAAWAKRES